MAEIILSGDLADVQCSLVNPDGEVEIAPGESGEATITLDPLRLYSVTVTERKPDAVFQATPGSMPHALAFNGTGAKSLSIPAKKPFRLTFDVKPIFGICSLPVAVHTKPEHSRKTGPERYEISIAVHEQGVDADEKAK